MEEIFCRGRDSRFKRNANFGGSSSLVQDCEAGSRRGHAELDFLCDRGGVDLVLPYISAYCANRGALTLPHRESIRPFWHYDPRQIRDRVPGFRRWENMGTLSVPL